MYGVVQPTRAPARCHDYQIIPVKAQDLPFTLVEAEVQERKAASSQRKAQHVERREAGLGRLSRQNGEPKASASSRKHSTARDELTENQKGKASSRTL